ncbi:DUF3488 domain-containing transglutaminase family protein [Nitrogeniibacter mangrovi]|uniref:DUF3488 domain-containing transglutaminase family protein n=1 Tax=Nitrogeniibacter mangrovi TaxID=2016596 RepID=A0A6C1B3Y9_9RHOO|nr:DUF3488 and transglutaminase-like domain-containing protein [Nitrogeniibacter mangrovi]QID18103.1 DUF3488 domain-containing transglutaminase family protein [Nitrogeniibacter mangrovi]
MTRAITPIPCATQHWMLASAAITIAPHLFHVPPWLGALAAMLLLWHAVRLHRRLTPPGRPILIVLTMLAVAAILVHFGTLLGKGPGVALLIVLLNLKLLESREPRDVHVFVLLSFFLQLSLFLDTESALTALGALAGALCATATLASRQRAGSARAQLRLAALLLLQAIPFMVVFFVLFPRIPGPLWGLPKDAYSGLTGLSDSMAPGSISQLSQSAEIAFRAAFDGAPPPPAQRYWRGPVLSDFDGRRWTDSRPATQATPDYRITGPVFHYTMTLEPHNRPWLLTMDFAGPGIPNARYTRDNQVVRRDPVNHRLRFDATAYPEAITGLDASEHRLARALRLPPGSNPRTVALGQALARQARTPAAIVAAAIDWMRQDRLAYTLQPPPLGVHTADEFLFETRRGFCEHFAGSFAILMRAAGVPTRVVTGYQGGELNPYDGTLVVRQSDAHAWTEVWLPGRGWVRVDPTAASAPTRIDGGLAAALPDGEPVPFMVGTDLDWLRNLRDRWEFLNNAWNQWVLGYDQARQRDLLSRLGLRRNDWTELATALFGITAMLFGALLWWSHRQARTNDPLLRQWQRLEARLARAGLARLPSEGPADYAMRVARAAPEHGPEIRDIARLYAELRYGRTPRRGRLQTLTEKINRFTIRRP